MPDNITVTLERFAWTPWGVFGQLSMPEFECYTVERPWRNNLPRVSCIPEGIYDMVLSRFNRGGYPAYELLGVPNRSLIKIHAGNTMDDVIGCIAVGKQPGYLNSRWAVTSSRNTLEGFMAAMGGAEQARIRVTAARL